MDLYDQHTANMRLQGCVIRIGGDPVFIDNIIHEAADRFRIQYHMLGLKQRNLINWGDEAINYSPVPLGNVNYKKLCFSIERIPNRQWKMGLYRQNLIIITSDGLEHNHQWDKRNEILDSRAIAKTIMGIYPSLRAAKNKLQDQREVAISRDFSIHTDGTLRHRYSGKVGKIVPKLKLHDKFFFLQQTVDELS